MTEPFTLPTISVKNLASLAMQGHCPRCFWIKSRLGFKAPWSIFPTIFNSIDGFSKQVTGVHLAERHAAPQWILKFGAVTDRIKVPHWSKFSFQDPASGIALRGEPDEMFHRPDGTLAILDYKTSRFTEAADRLSLLYRAQLGGYRWIARNLGMGETSLTGLIYFDPDTKATGDSLTEAGFRMGFTAIIRRVETDLGEIGRFLLEAKRIVGLPKPPDGTAGCKDCVVVDQLRALEMA
jgi:hypothetical protein